MPIAGRPYRDDADRDCIRRFLSAAHVADAPRLRYWHPGGDIIWNMYQNLDFDPRASFHLWEEAGELVGVGWFEEPNEFDLQVHPRLLGRGLIEELALSWAMERARAHFDEAGGMLRARTRTSFTGTVAFLTNHGFVRDTRTPPRLVERRGYPPDGYYMVQFRRDLRDLPEPAPPAGWSVRPVGGEEEWPARVEHR